MSKMKNIISFSLILIFTLTLTHAQDKDLKAQNILKEATDLARTYKSIQISFTYTMENKEASIKDSYSGTLLMQGDRYRVDVGGQRVISDGKTIWTYIKDADEVQIHDADDSGEAMVPSKLLTTYSDDFKAKLIREDIENGKKNWVIDLTPSTGKSFFKVRLTIDQTKKQVTSFAIFEKNGSTFTYKIKEFKTNVTLDPNTFVFNKKDYPGVDIIDMR